METLDRLHRAKDVAKSLYDEFGEIGARKYVMEMKQKSVTADEKGFWCIVNDNLNTLANPAHKKPKSYQIHPDQMNLQKKRVRF